MGVDGLMESCEPQKVHKNSSQGARSREVGDYIIPHIPPIPPISGIDGAFASLISLTPYFFVILEVEFDSASSFDDRYTATEFGKSLLEFLFVILA